MIVGMGKHNFLESENVQKSHITIRAISFVWFIHVLLKERTIQLAA